MLAHKKCQIRANFKNLEPLCACWHKTLPDQRNVSQLLFMRHLLFPVKPCPCQPSFHFPIPGMGSHSSMSPSG